MPRLRRASYLELRAAGHDAVDPADLALYSDTQYAQPGFPFVRFGPDLPVRWVLGESLIDRRPVWVPVSLVWVTYPELATSRGEPSTNGTIYAGIAAGPGQPAAELSACLELVERDGVDLVRSIGADDVIDYTREDFADRSRCYDLILDTAGNHPLSHLRHALSDL